MSDDLPCRDSILRLQLLRMEEALGNKCSNLQPVHLISVMRQLLDLTWPALLPRGSDPPHVLEGLCCRAGWWVA